MLALRRILPIALLRIFPGLSAPSAPAPAPAPALTPAERAAEEVKRIGASLVQQALLDFHGGASEADVSNEGRLAGIFRDSGWARGVDNNAKTGKPKDWCGMSVAAWAKRCGLIVGHRPSFWHTDGVRSFFSYRTRGQHHRTATWASLGEGPFAIEDWHDEAHDRRQWHEGRGFQGKLAAGELTPQPGDVVLINHDGNTDQAHHITLVEACDGRWLVTLEGNASGEGPDGRRRRQACVRVRRDLKDPAVLATVFGLGRFSSLDFAGGYIVGR